MEKEKKNRIERKKRIFACKLSSVLLLQRWDAKEKVKKKKKLKEKQIRMERMIIMIWSKTDANATHFKHV